MLRARALAAHGEHSARAFLRPHRPPAALSHRHRGIAGMGLYRRAAGAAQGFSRRGLAALEKEEAPRSGWALLNWVAQINLKSEVAWPRTHCLVNVKPKSVPGIESPNARCLKSPVQRL